MSIGDFALHLEKIEIIRRMDCATRCVEALVAQRQVGAFMQSFQKVAPRLGLNFAEIRRPDIALKRLARSIVRGY